MSLCKALKLKSLQNTSAAVFPNDINCHPRSRYLRVLVCPPLFATGKLTHMFHPSFLPLVIGLFL